MEKMFYIDNEYQMIVFGEKLAKFLLPNMVITLEGDLGAGKTTLTKGIAKGLGIKEILNSPTFTIMKIYQGKMTLYHMDVYRINNDSGDEYLEEFFYKDGIAVIEWANNISDILPSDCLNIKIEYLDEHKRLLTLQGSILYNELIESVRI